MGNQLTRRSQLIRVFGILSTLAALAGCTGKVRYPNYYLLNVAAPPAANDSSKPILGSLAVREFSAPQFLRQGPIAYKPSPEQLEFYNYHRWAMDPRRVVTNAVIQRVQSRGIFRSVDPFDDHENPDCLVTGSVDHLEEVDRGSSVSIEVGLSARLVSLRTGEVLWQGASSRTAKLEQRSVPGIVAEMSQAMGDAVEELVSSMQSRIFASSPLSKSATQNQE